MHGVFSTCTATFISGARIGSATTHKMTWLTRKDQKKVKSVCCVAARGTAILRSAARQTVEGTYLPNVSPSADSVSASSWTKLTFVLLLCSLIRAKRGFDSQFSFVPVVLNKLQPAPIPVQR